MGNLVAPEQFSESYKQNSFLTWYKQGKPGPTEFMLSMPTDDYGRRPGRDVVHTWMAEWRLKAAELDAGIENSLVEEVVAKKVEMLQRHSQTGKEIQDISLAYLRDHKDEITPHAAVRLLQLGIDIERQSVGVPEALEKMSKLDDDEILNEISSILQSSNVDITLIDAELKSVEDDVEDGNNSQEV